MGSAEDGVTGSRANPDIVVWIQSSNAERTHTGKYCYGKTPLQTFIDSAKLAYDCDLARI